MGAFRSTKSKVSTRSLFLIVALCIISCTVGRLEAAGVPQSVIQRQNTYLGAFPGVDIGVGFNSLTSSVAGYCVDKPASASCDETRKSAQYHKRFVSQSSALKETLGIAASASFGTGVWGAEASASFASSKTVLSDSAYLYLDVEVQLGDTNIDVALRKDKLKLLKRDPVAFVAGCGDSYVATVTQGGRYRVIYEFKHVSDFSKQDLAVSLSGSGATWNVDASLKQGIERSVEQYETELYVFQAGGKFEKSTMSFDELIKKANGFAAEVTCSDTTSARSTILAITKSYYTTKDFPAGSRVPDLSQQLREIDELAPVFDRAMVLANDLSERLANPGRLNDRGCETDKSALTQKQELVAKYVVAARRKVDGCQKVSKTGPTADCLADVQVSPMPLELPRLTQPDKCGPACTERAGSAFSSDQYGYCTRCTWDPRGRDVPKAQIAEFMESECRFMRRGSKVLVRANGNINPNLKPDEGDSWIEFGATASSGGKGYALGAGHPDQWLSYTNAKARKSFDFALYAWVSKKAELAAVTAGLHQQMCQKSWAQGNSPCQYEHVVIDICDVANSKGCAWPVP